MAKDIVINVKNVEKSFKIYSDKGYTLKERLLFFKQRNSYTRHEVLKGVTLEIEKGEVVGLVGLGNQFAFGESFCGGIRHLYDVIVKKGAKVVGFTSTDGYHYEETSIIEDGKFIGLALDEENQANLTPKRIGDWITEIKKEFK